MNTQETDLQTVAAAFDGLPLSIAILDPGGRIIRTNREWDRFATENGGAPAACGVGVSYLDACASGGPVAGRAAAGLSRVLAGDDQPFTLEYPCHSPDEQRWFIMRAASLQSPSGAVIGAVVSHLNITGRRTAEDALRRYTSRLEQVNQDLDDFAVRIAHDLKEPLRSISYQSHILTVAAAALPPESMETVLSIERLAQRGIDMTEGLLKYARLGLLEIDLQELSLETLTEHAIESLASSLHDSNAQINIERPLPSILGEPTLLTEAIMNLIANGIKYNTSQPKRIEIGPLYRSGGRRGIFIRDNGIGIDPAHHERIFKPFERADTSRPGSGIGLALVKRIVDLHGGQLWLDSAPGQGSTFFLSLPPIPQSDVQPDARPGSGPAPAAQS